jgi:hypothetical protein
MFNCRFSRQMKLFASAALLAIGFAGCSGGEEEAIDAADTPSDLIEASEVTESSEASEVGAPDADESTAFCNGCYVSFQACQFQVVPGSGCTCGTGVCGCSGAVPVGMTCP